MERLLISWIAHNNDFTNNPDGGLMADAEGTTASFHRHFYNQEYTKHILLSSKPEDDLRAVHLQNLLARDFTGHAVEIRHLDIQDVIDLEQIRSKIEPILLVLRDKAIDIFISPGTPTMQTAWVLAHMTLGLNTRLLQVRPKEFTPSKKQPELIEVDIAKDATTSSAIIRQQSLDRPSEDRLEKDIYIGDSIKPVYQLALQIAHASGTNVLILGDTGTGKEHLARYIHQQSPRRTFPFRVVNCSAMGDQLLESRLFGHRKGSFTGAEDDTPGLIAEAKGGTVFLDEIGDISPYMQQVLLRVLQEKEVAPIGGKPYRVDVRFISATNRDLLALCEQGKFRWDLYYRLNGVDLRLPSLEERGIEETKKLIHHFLKTKKKLFNHSKMLELPGEVMDKLLAYPYPGNIRELENLIERLYVLSREGTVSIDKLPPRVLQSPETTSLLLKDVEKRHIARVLKLNKGKQRKTARDLGVAYNTLMKKVRGYGLGG